MGTSPTSLSSINSGDRPLGHNLGSRLAEALGVSLIELGAPVGETDPAGLTLVRRLEALEERVEKMASGVADSLDRLEGAVSLLLQRIPPTDAQTQETTAR